MKLDVIHNPCIIMCPWKMSGSDFNFNEYDDTENMISVTKTILFFTNRSWNVTDITSNIYISKLTHIEDYMVAMFLTCTGVCSLFLNTLVIYVCFRKRHLLISSDYYIVNLAFSDIILPVLGFPFAVSSSFGHGWNFGHQGCQAYGFVGFFCGVVSITTLALMSFVRYISVCRTNLKNVFAKHTSVIIFSTYIYASLWALPPIFGWGDYGVEPHGTSCTLKWAGNRAFVTLMLITCIVLPVLVMNVCYGLVWGYLKKNTKSLRKWRPCKSKWNKREWYLIKITFTMCCTFIGTWTPYAVVSLWSAYGSAKTIPTRVTLAAVLLAKLATVINPLVYFMLNKKFNPFVKEYLRTTWRTILLSSTSKDTEVQVYPVALEDN